MGKFVLKTAKRETTVKRAVIREAVRRAFQVPITPGTPAKKAGRNRAAAKKA